jgi:hypothetical protein
LFPVVRPPAAAASPRARRVTGILNSLIGLLAGFLVGRTTDVIKPPKTDTMQPKDERGQMPVGRAMLAGSGPQPQEDTMSETLPPDDELEEVGQYDLIDDDGDDELEDDGTGEDVGTFDPGDLDADGIPDELEVDDLDELVGGVDPDSNERPEEEDND